MEYYPKITGISVTLPFMFQPHMIESCINLAGSCVYFPCGSEIQFIPWNNGTLIERKKVINLTMEFILPMEVHFMPAPVSLTEMSSTYDAQAFFALVRYIFVSVLQRVEFTIKNCLIINSRFLSETV